MGEPRTIAGCSVLKEATAREYSRHKVVICELPDAKEGENRFVVWYINNKDKPTAGQFYEEREAAQAEFDRRTR